MLPKVLSLGALGVGALLLLIFLADIAAGVPFGGANATMDICMILGSGITIYLGWSAYRSAE